VLGTIFSERRRLPQLATGVLVHARPSLQAVIQPILPLLGKRWKELE
jgi:hypothetical protein